MFDDIEAKGATRGYNTKYNESMHKSPKKSFLQQGNFRDVAEGVSDDLNYRRTGTHTNTVSTDFASRRVAILCLLYSNTH